MSRGFYENPRFYGISSTVMLSKAIRTVKVVVQKLAKCAFLVDVRQYYAYDEPTTAIAVMQNRPVGSNLVTTSFFFF